MSREGGVSLTLTSSPPTLHNAAWPTPEARPALGMQRPPAGAPFQRRSRDVFEAFAADFAQRGVGAGSSRHDVLLALWHAIDQEDDPIMELQKGPLPDRAVCLAVGLAIAGLSVSHPCALLDFTPTEPICDLQTCVDAFKEWAQDAENKGMPDEFLNPQAWPCKRPRSSSSDSSENDGSDSENGDSNVDNFSDVNGGLSENSADSDDPDGIWPSDG